MSPEEIEARKTASANRLAVYKADLEAEKQAIRATLDPVKHSNLWRDPLSLKLLCAFNNVDVPPPGDLTNWERFANPWMAAAWKRVADIVREEFRGDP